MPKDGEGGIDAGGKKEDGTGLRAGSEKTLSYPPSLLELVPGK